MIVYVSRTQWSPRFGVGSRIPWRSDAFGRPRTLRVLKVLGGVFDMDAVRVVAL